MQVRILTNNDFPNIQNTKEKFDIFRVINIKSNSKLEIVEFFNKDGVFRGFGRNSKVAYKKALRAVKKYYK